MSALPACDVCAKQDTCEIRAAMIEIEADHSVKLRLGYCPDFEPEERGTLYELWPDEGGDDLDLFSPEDLA